MKVDTLTKNRTMNSSTTVTTVWKIIILYLLACDDYGVVIVLYCHFIPFFTSLITSVNKRCNNLVKAWYQHCCVDRFIEVTFFTTETFRLWTLAYKQKRRCFYVEGVERATGNIRWELLDDCGSRYRSLRSRSRWVLFSSECNDEPCCTVCAA